MKQSLKQKIIELHEKHGDIEIRCAGRDSLPLDIILDFQGKLKKRSEQNLLKLIERIFKLGFIAPFFVWEHEGSYYDLDGHGRSEAMNAVREAGVPIPGMFPVDYIQADSKEEAREILLSISSQYGEFDTVELSEWLNGLGESVAESIRLVDTEIKVSFPGEDTESDDEVPEEVEPITKLGDLWELGNHRLLCGNSTKEEDVERLMNGKKACICFTDPPYGVGIGDKNKFLNSFQPSGRNLKDIVSDNEKPEDLKEILVKAFINARKIAAAEDCTFFVTAPQGGELGMMMMMMMKEAGMPVRHVLMWYKNAPTFSMGRLDYDYQHEPILLTWGKKHKRPMEGEHRSSVWKIDKPRKSAEHPTMKPVELYDNAYLNNSDDGDISYEPFAGSGTAFISSEKTGRTCYGMELDPHYCDVTVTRYKEWCEANGKNHEIKLNGKPHSF